jgi:tRNA pseudouridine55 synthase
MMRIDLEGVSDRVVLVDKPAGCTSHDVVAWVRAYLGVRRVGHAGTLDPFATGLLLVLTGRGTKLFPMLSSLDKVYEGVLELGIETSSGDPMGEVTRRTSIDGISENDVRRQAATLVGAHDQIPPMTSAVKYRGQPLYKLNRQGVEVERQPRAIRVEEFDVTNVELPNVRFRTRCSKGTYVRSLAERLGRELGVGGHLSALRRTAIGFCRVEEAATLEALQASSPNEALSRFGLSLAEALDGVAAVRLNAAGVRKVRCGAYPTPADLLDWEGVPETGSLVRLLDPGGELVAVGRSSNPETGSLRTRRIELVRVI